MPQPETPQTPQAPQQNGYFRRGKTALWVTSALLLLSLMVLTVGFLSATRTDNVSVAGFYSGITLSFGAFLGILALHLVENRRPMLIASIIFISMGIITAFLCAIVDGIIASQLIVRLPFVTGSVHYLYGQNF
uniref:Uncharacterized protein n=1 Tax=Neogobius melanostomus TaxID=47308 RepID=A0A8C6TM88_9GOBI